MVEKVAQHAHCHICGKAIPTTETLCSEECKQKYKALLKRNNIYRYILYAAMFVVLIVFILNAMGTQ